MFTRMPAVYVMVTDLPVLGQLLPFFVFVFVANTNVFTNSYRLWFATNPGLTVLQVPIPGPRQTNNRGHMYALLHAIQVGNEFIFAYMICVCYSSFCYLQVCSLDVDKTFCIRCCSKILVCYILQMIAINYM